MSFHNKKFVRYFDDDKCQKNTLYDLSANNSE